MLSCQRFQRISKPLGVLQNVFIDHHHDTHSSLCDAKYDCTTRTGLLIIHTIESLGQLIYIRMYTKEPDNMLKLPNSRKQNYLRIVRRSLKALQKQWRRRGSFEDKK
jgi:hypothetical protein